MPERAYNLNGQQVLDTILECWRIVEIGGDHNTEGLSACTAASLLLNPGLSKDNR